MRLLFKVNRVLGSSHLVAEGELACKSDLFFCLPSCHMPPFAGSLAKEHPPLLVCSGTPLEDLRSTPGPLSTT